MVLHKEGGPKTVCVMRRVCSITKNANIVCSDILLSHNNRRDEFASESCNGQCHGLTGVWPFSLRLTYKDDNNIIL